MGNGAGFPEPVTGARRFCALFALAVALATPPLTGSGSGFRYRGICDASAAVAITPDHFVVADDEHNALFIYQTGRPKAAGTVDLADYLGSRKQDGKTKESDIEGAARIGDRVYWIASHARDSRGNVEETRLRFFATEVATGKRGTPTVKPVSRPPYNRLLQDLIADQRLGPLGLADASRNAAEDRDGLNIEGLAATPGNGLLIGFRNPLPGGKALIVPLQNPDAVIDASAKAAFGDALFLDLGGRGVRSIELIDDHYLIVAGPFDDGKGGGSRSDFALFAWSGRATAQPTLLAHAVLGSLHPEALFATPGTSFVQLLSDDGGEKVQGVACKESALSKKSFRTLSLELPRR